MLGERALDRAVSRDDRAAGRREEDDEEERAKRYDRARSAFEGVEEEARRNEQRKCDHDDDGHAAEILRDVTTLPRRGSLEARGRRADRA